MKSGSVAKSLRSIPRLKYCRYVSENLASPTRLLWGLVSLVDYVFNCLICLCFRLSSCELSRCSHLRQNSQARNRRAGSVAKSLRLKARAAELGSSHPRIEIRRAVPAFYRTFSIQQLEFYICRGGGFLGDTFEILQALY